MSSSASTADESRRSTLPSTPARPRRDVPAPCDGAGVRGGAHPGDRRRTAAARARDPRRGGPGGGLARLRRRRARRRRRAIPMSPIGLKELRGELSRVVTELRLSIFDLRSRGGRRPRTRLGPVGLRAQGRRTILDDRPPDPGRGTDAAQPRRRDRAVPDRAGGDHERAQALTGRESLGGLLGAAAVGVASESETTAEDSAQAGRTPTACASCASARNASTPSVTCRADHRRRPSDQARV